METCKKCGKTGKNKMKDGLCKSCRMKVWTCKKCGNPYRSIYERDVCIECEQKATNIVCDICGRSFKTKKSLSNHSRYHDSEYTNMMSDKLKGRVFSEETRKKMSESARGRKDSAETRAKKSQVMRDRWSDEDYRRRYHENNAGKKLSESTKAILSNIRKKAWQTEEYRQHQSDALIAAMSFGKSRFNKKYEWECLRYCSKDNWQVYGAMSRLQKAFIEDAKPKSVISYTDLSKSNAGGSEAIGRHLVGYTGPSLIWYDFSSMYRDTLVRAKGANAILGTKYGSRADTGLDNHGIMLAEGFYGVYDCGSKVYELQL